MTYIPDQDDADAAKDLIRLLARMDLADNGLYEIDLYENGFSERLTFSVHSI